MFEGDAVLSSQAGSCLQFSKAPSSGTDEDADLSAFESEGSSRYDGAQLLYLGISGVLHPSKSTHELLEGISPWENGHKPYEAVSWLAQVLMLWPLVRIVLTSTQPWKHGLDHVHRELRPMLASRVLGFTYEDLTSQHSKPTRGKGQSRLVRHSDAEYWRMNKSDIVSAHVAWARPMAWVAVDDEDILWRGGMRNQLALVDGNRGLLYDPDGQTNVLRKFAANFGPPVKPPVSETG